MGLPLLLPLLLLLLLASLQAGEWPGPYVYEVNQPEQLSAPEGGSVQIPFSFCHPWELPSVLSVSISWRWKHYHGETIYNTTLCFIHKNFENRLSLNWTEDGRSGFLQISNLRREDECMYFCRVQLTAQNHGKVMWQSIFGTNLQLPLTVHHDQADTLVCIALVTLHNPTITAGIAIIYLFQMGKLRPAEPKHLPKVALVMQVRYEPSLTPESPLLTMSRSASPTDLIILLF
uniref:Ig-like domain-containing protein n=1 Tax=Rhinolophus ferrumequinum TaxID=59479 RepID=A0A671E177_RHIFE